MLINNLRDEKIDLVDEIYEVLSLIFKGIFKILKFFNLEHFSDSIDTFGFSIKKLFGLLFDIKPLNESLTNVIVVTGKQLISYSNEYVLIKSQKIIINFLSKLIILLVFFESVDNLSTLDSTVNPSIVISKSRST